MGDARLGQYGVARSRGVGLAAMLESTPADAFRTRRRCSRANRFRRLKVK